MVAIAREGRLPLLVLGLAAVVIAHSVHPWWALPVVVLALVTAYVFREPHRKLSAKPLGVVSPVDGVIEDIEQAHDPWLDREGCRVTVRLDRPGITALRGPVEGKVMELWTNHDDRAGRSPTQYTAWIRTDESEDVVFSIRTLRYSRLRLDVPPGQRVGQGQRAGFVYFGNRVDVFMPASIVVRVKQGTRVLAGAGTLGEFARARIAE